MFPPRYPNRLPYGHQPYGQQGYGQQGYDYGGGFNRYQGGQQVGGGDLYQISQLLAQMMGQPQSTEQPQAMSMEQYNPMMPDPGFLSPMGRFNAMLMRDRANKADLAAEAQPRMDRATQARIEQAAMEAGPPPMTPYTVTEPVYGSGNKTLTSKYGTGSVTQAIPGTVPRGMFTTDDGQSLPFGQIGGTNAGQDTLDPSNVTFQQWQAMNRSRMEDEDPKAKRLAAKESADRIASNNAVNATLKSIGL